MSIATALQNAQAKVAAAYSKCNDKGATMPVTQDLDHLDDCIDSIPTGTAPNLQTLNVTPTTSAQQITPTSSVDGYDEVNVAAVTAAIDQNIVAGNIKKDVSILGVTGTLAAGLSLDGYTKAQNVSIVPTSVQSSATFVVPNELGEAPKLAFGIIEGDITGRSSVQGPFFIAYSQITGMLQDKQTLGSILSNGNIAANANAIPTITLVDDTISLYFGNYTHPNVQYKIYLLA